MICNKCGKDTKSYRSLGREGAPYCFTCLREMSEEGNICPCCGHESEDKDKEVALVLTPANSSEEQKAKAPEVVCVVCPECRNLYFDKLAYAIMQSLKQD